MDGEHVLEAISVTENYVIRVTKGTCSGDGVASSGKFVGQFVSILDWQVNLIHTHCINYRDGDGGPWTTFDILAHEDASGAPKSTLFLQNMDTLLEVIVLFLDHENGEYVETKYVKSNVGPLQIVHVARQSATSSNFDGIFRGN